MVDLWWETRKLEDKSLIFPNMFRIFVDIVAFSVSILLGFLARPIDQVTGIVVNRCRCREEVDVDELERKVGGSCLA